MSPEPSRRPGTFRSPPRRHQVGVQAQAQPVPRLDGASPCACLVIVLRVPQEARQERCRSQGQGVSGWERRTGRCLWADTIVWGVPHVPAHARPGAEPRAVRELPVASLRGGKRGQPHAGIHKFVLKNLSWEPNGCIALRIKTPSLGKGPAPPSRATKPRPRPLGSEKAQVLGLGPLLSTWP